MACSYVLERSLARERDAPGTLRRRVYIFFTRAGLLFLLTLAVMLLGAVNYTNSMAYLLTFLLGGVALVCILHTYRNLRGLVLQVGDGEPVFAGETARFPLVFDNRDGEARVGLEVQERRRRGQRADGQVLRVDVAGESLQRTFFGITAPRRGVFRLPALVIRSVWPLGLVRAWSWLDNSAQCLVYPRPLGARPLPGAEPFEADQFAGQQPGTDDFSGFRAYQPGDSIRRIDWKALAREQGVLVKRFSGAGSHRITLRWSLAGPEQGIEACLSQLCRWVLDADAEGLLYALEVPGARVPHGNGTDHRRACLDVLARFGS